jgi:hypothetical protein
MDLGECDINTIGLQQNSPIEIMRLGFGKPNVIKAAKYIKY